MIAPDGTITATRSDLVVREGSRPKTADEAGANPETFAQIRNRTPGEFQTPAFLGGATAIVVPFRALAWLPDTLMERLRVKYGFDAWPDEVLVMLVRNTGAPAIQNAAEPAGGMAEDTNLLLEQLKEIVEVGVYREPGGWVRFLLSDGLTAHQAAFDAEQQNAWEIVSSSTPWTHGHEARLEILPVGSDMLDGRRGVVTVGPVGDFSFLSIARLHLEGAGWQLFDTEARPGKDGETEWVALHRTVIVVVPREGKSPIGFQFGDDGRLHPCGVHVALSGEAWDLNLTHVGRAAIEALNWKGDQR